MATAVAPTLSAFQALEKLVAEFVSERRADNGTGPSTAAVAKQAARTVAGPGSSEAEVFEDVLDDPDPDITGEDSPDDAGVRPDCHKAVESDSLKVSPVSPTATKCQDVWEGLSVSSPIAQKKKRRSQTQERYGRGAGIDGTLLLPSSLSSSPTPRTSTPSALVQSGFKHIVPDRLYSSSTHRIQGSLLLKIGLNFCARLSPLATLLKKSLRV